MEGVILDRIGQPGALEIIGQQRVPHGGAPRRQRKREHAPSTPVRRHQSSRMIIDGGFVSE
jgi:hypothetical protein